MQNRIDALEDDNLFQNLKFHDNIDAEDVKDDQAEFVPGSDEAESSSDEELLSDDEAAESKMFGKKSKVKKIRKDLIGKKDKKRTRHLIV